MLHKLFVTIKKRYRSPIDKALETFRKNRPISKSQEAEIKKHEKIHQLRDKAQPIEPNHKIWEDF
ncbi:MAG TPA: CBU_0585 family protein [Gammaproteobacteria bacterium]|nr:CBU_0585 family protein [Gammaproteobacteria bacterium]